MKYDKFYDAFALSLAKEKGIGQNWGWEYLGDYAQSTVNKIDNEEVIRKFMDEMVKKLKMKKVDKLWIKTFKEKPYPHAAVSAVQVIESSTIVYHGENRLDSFFIDVFSCESFDPDIIPAIVDKYFAPKVGQGKFFLRQIGRIVEKSV